MSLVRSPIDILFNHMLDRMEEAFVPSYTSAHSYSYLHPTEDGYEYEVPVPGMTRENVKIQLDERASTMYIKADTEKKNKYSKIASNYQYVQSLPKDVDVESISATVEHGVLTVSMKRIQKQQNVKEIPIR